jgi:hypothetical protein
MDPVLMLHLLIGAVLPMLVGLVTTKLTHPGLKAVLLAGLTIVTSVAAELAADLQEGTPFKVTSVLLIAAGQFVWSVGLHYGLLAPTQLSEKLAGIGITADPRQVQLKEMGWHGPLPTGAELEKKLMDAEQMIDVQATEEVVGMTSPDVVFQTPAGQTRDEKTMQDYDTVATDRRASMVTRLGDSPESAGRHRSEG